MRQRRSSALPFRTGTQAISKQGHGGHGPVALHGLRRIIINRRPQRPRTCRAAGLRAVRATRAGRNDMGSRSRSGRATRQWRGDKRAPSERRSRDPAYKASNARLAPEPWWVQPIRFSLARLTEILRDDEQRFSPPAPTLKRGDSSQPNGGKHYVLWPAIWRLSRESEGGMLISVCRDASSAGVRTGETTIGPCATGVKSSSLTPRLGRPWHHRPVQTGNRMPLLHRARHVRRLATSDSRN